MVWTIVAWLLSAASGWTLTIAFHLHLPVVSGILVAVGVGLAMILPSGPAAVGVFEGPVIVILRASHVPSTEALPYAVVLHLVNLIPFVLAGARAAAQCPSSGARARRPRAQGVALAAGSPPVRP